MKIITKEKNKQGNMNKGNITKNNNKSKDFQGLLRPFQGFHFSSKDFRSTPRKNNVQKVSIYF